VDTPNNSVPSHPTGGVAASTTVRDVVDGNGRVYRIGESDRQILGRATLRGDVGGQARAATAGGATPPETA
jgi:hypothetical protein